MGANETETPAAELSRKLGEPILNPIIKKWVGRGEMEYERYLKTQVLTSLQLPESERVCHDELMFQISHQTQELWLELLSREMVQVVDALDGDRSWDASFAIERCARIARHLARELDVLETLTPKGYQTLRHHLGTGSGQESPGYNKVRLAAGGLSEAVDRLVERRGFSLAAVYLDGAAPDLERVFEQLVDLDEGFQSWLVAHYLLVRRTIGVSRDVKALDGLPTQILAGRMTQPLLPKLWEVREEMTRNWKREAGFAPGAPRVMASGASASEPGATK